MNQRDLQDRIRSNAWWIGKLLHLRGTQDQRPPGRLTHRFKQVIQNAAAQGPTTWVSPGRADQGRSEPGRAETSVYAALSRLSRDIDRTKQAYFTCLILLDLLHFLEAGTQATRDVVRLLRECYAGCRAPSYRETLQETLAELQASSFPVVRQIVLEIRELEPATADDLRVLRDYCAFPEARTAVARRVLLHSQVDHLPALLDYLVRAYRTADLAERKAAEALIGRLGEFEMTVIVPPLFRAYIDHFEDPPSRGKLMRVLTGFGDPLVPQLEQIYTSNRVRERAPTVRLLRQMIGFGSVAAARALVAIVEQPRDDLADPKNSRAREDWEDASGQLVQAGRDVAETQGAQSFRGMAVRDVFDEAARRWSGEAPDVGRPGQPPGTSVGMRAPALAQQLAALPWDVGLTPELVERVVTRQASAEEVQRLRRGGRRAAELLGWVARDLGRGETERCAALRALSNLYGQAKRPATRDLLWQVYRDELSPTVQVEALLALQRAEAALSAEARKRLYADYRTGSGPLRDAIARAWPVLFPDAPQPTA